MASADQIKALIKSHYDSDSNRFSTVALQLAANEAKSGHKILAREIKQLVDKAKGAKFRVIPNVGNLDDLIQVTDSNTRIGELIVSPKIEEQLSRILSEFKQKSKLEKHGFSNRRKILITGPPGTGKTLTASVLSTETKMPLYVVYTDKIIAKYMGETASKLRQIFDFISLNQGVYFFDEFDAIGAERNRDNDVGEIRRVLNSFLQFLELDKSNSFIVAATNNIGILDQALFRRFDDVLFYEMPTYNQALMIIKNRLASFPYRFNIDILPKKYFTRLSHAEITLACDDAIKDCILNNENTLKRVTLARMLEDRREIYSIKM